jgi:membrane protease YdiL (CAAX protease family)
MLETSTMAERSPTDPNGALPTPAATSPQALLPEALSLAAILGISLILSALEARSLTAWYGYPSSLLLLGLAWWHKRRFRVAISFWRRQTGGRTFPIVFPLGLVSLLLISAYAPLWPQAGRGPILQNSLHLLLLVPLAEEFYFRGLLFDHLRRGFSARGAVVGCSLLFATLHLPNGGAIGAGLLSLIACLLVLRTGGWGYALQLHVAYDGLSQVNRIGDFSSRWAWGVFASVVIVALSFHCGGSAGGPTTPASRPTCRRAGRVPFVIGAPETAAPRPWRPPARRWGHRPTVML